MLEELSLLNKTMSMSRWCHPTISSSVIPFSSCLQSFPASGSFSVSQFFPSGGQRIGASASTSVLPMIIQDWFPLGWPGWISLQSKGLSRVFSNTTVQKHQFFGAQLSLWSNSHITSWSHHFKANRSQKSWNSDRLFSRAPKSLQMVIAIMKIKDTCSLDEKLW